MHTLSQFRPTLYALLLLGMLGFGLASESPGVWALGTGGILLNAWLVRTRRFTPMPRLVANLVTIGSTIYVAQEVWAAGTTAVMVIGKFLVLLQLIKLWEQRANRDYAQLIVLSLLLMVAGSINTTSLLFAIVLIVFLFLALYCSLLFHLKAESDTARTTHALPVERLSPTTLRQDERFLGRSMRRLTAFVSVTAVMTAVVVFLLFPRGAGAGMFAPLQFRPSQALTGFSESVNFQGLARITQNQAEVAKVEVWRNDQPVDGTETLLLRGITLDQYNTQENSGSGQWEWVRTINRYDQPHTVSKNEPWTLAPPAAPKGDRYRQVVRLQPTGTRALFTVGAAFQITPKTHLRLRYNTADATVKTEEPLTREIAYEVVATDELPVLRAPGAALMRRLRARPVSARIRDYVRNPDVSGTAPDGASLAEQRKPLEYVSPVDEAIASSIEQHLQSQFVYTLDLTDAEKLSSDDDPMVAFLYDLKRGHCEYFAGAMALMCQSLGMQARVVNGFKCEEFNELGGYYIVRQSHAHSWVEVLTLGPDGAPRWRTFDPTSATEDGAARAGLWQKVKHLFDFLEFTYAKSVIAYDYENRENLMSGVNHAVQNTTQRGSQSLNSFRDWFDAKGWGVSSNVISGIVVLIALALAGSVLWFVAERWALRRRAARIGLDKLSDADQMRLVRQLGFYDDLVRLLARHHISRPRHLTPLEFSRTLLHLPSEAYDTIRRLTQVFYRVRYGHAELSGGQQRRLGTVISRLEQRLGAPSAAGAMGKG